MEPGWLEGLLWEIQPEITVFLQDIQNVTHHTTFQKVRSMQQETRLWVALAPHLLTGKTKTNKQTKAKFLFLVQSSKFSENYVPEANTLTHSFMEGERAEEVSVPASPGKNQLIPVIYNPRVVHLCFFGRQFLARSQACFTTAAKGAGMLHAMSTVLPRRSVKIISTFLHNLEICNCLIVTSSSVGSHPLPLSLHIEELKNSISSWSLNHLKPEAKKQILCNTCRVEFSPS